MNQKQIKTKSELNQACVSETNLEIWFQPYNFQKVFSKVKKHPYIGITSAMAASAPEACILHTVHRQCNALLLKS